MGTKAKPGANGVTPWLELEGEAGAVQRIELEEFPATVGRIESADVHVPSTRVSREHAVLAMDGRGVVVRDLGSTNGTFVNGDRVDEATLMHGDVVVFADVELTFHAPRSTATEPMATQVMPTMAQADWKEAVLEVRRLHETLNRRALVVRYSPIMDLMATEPFGYQVSCQPDISSSFSDCRWTERLLELQRVVACEQIRQHEWDTVLLFPLQADEVGRERLVHVLDRLRSGGSKVLVEIPDSAVCDIPYFRSFLDDLRAAEVLIGYGDFHGGTGRVEELREIAPDYLKLNPALVSGIARSSGGQRHLQSVIKAVNDIGAEAIVSGVSDAAQVEAIQQLGCRLAEGEYFGAPQPLLLAGPALVVAQ